MTMKKLTKENKLYYMGAALSAIACIIALIGVVLMISGNDYTIWEIIVSFLGLSVFALLSNYFYQKA